jgi:hypothetical protein
MIPLLINQSNISQDFSLHLLKCLADSDLVVIGLTGIGPIWKISVLAQWKFLYYIDRFDHIKANKSKLINNVCYYIVILFKQLYWLSCCHLTFRKIWYCLIKTRIDLVSLSFSNEIYEKNLFHFNVIKQLVFCIGQYKF